MGTRCAAASLDRLGRLCRFDQGLSIRRAHRAPPRRGPHLGPTLHTLTEQSMRIAMLAPISWRTPPRHYGPWELVTSLLTEALVARGVDVTLFATADSITSG